MEVPEGFVERGSWLKPAVLLRIFSSSSYYVMRNLYWPFLCLYSLSFSVSFW